MKEAENDIENDLQSCLLYHGLAGLYTVLQEPDSEGADMAKAHSNTWIAVHFSWRSPSRDSELNPILLKSAETGILGNDNTFTRNSIEKLPPLSNRESLQMPHNVADFLSLGTAADEYIRLIRDPGPYNQICARNLVLQESLQGFPTGSVAHLILQPANLHVAQILTEWWSGKIDDALIPS